MRQSVWAFITAGMLGLAGCGSDSDEQPLEQLEKRREQWRQARSNASYTFLFERTGFFPHGPRLRLSVEGDEVTRVAFAEPQPPAAQPWLTPEQAPTIDDLFSEVEQNLESGEADVSVAYDPWIHYPRSAWFDWGFEGGGFTVEVLDIVTPLEGT